jgi:glycosyltransferase involved in cell wall biosynthesis
MKVAVIDPSLFTIPYDCALCDALVAEGCEVGFYGRPMRASETMAGGIALRPFFYKMSERFQGSLPKPAFRLVKGVEHTLDMMRLQRDLARERPDIIHFQWAPLPVVDKRLVGAFRRIAPVVLTVHDTTPFNGSPNSSLQAMGALAIFAAFDHLVVHTEQGRAQLVARGIPERKVSVVPHGVLALPAAAATANSNEKSERTILLFGKIKPYKGTDVLIEAFARLPDALRRSARLRIVGEPFIDLAPLQARAVELGIADRVDWEPGYIGDDEIGRLLSAADILAFPYRDIDASGVLMASFPYGKPIVASAIGAFKELLRDGEHGRLVPSNDPDALAAALAGLLADPEEARAMGERVRAIAAGIPGWDEIARRTIELYRGLAGRAGGGVAASAHDRAGAAQMRSTAAEAVASSDWRDAPARAWTASE